MTVVIPDPPRDSRALWRIRFAVQAEAPVGAIQWVYPTSEAAADADLWIVTVVGQHDRVLREVTRIRATGARVALVQVVWRSSLQPTADAWRPIWDQCTVVWSTYRLPTAALYHAPFGVTERITRGARVGPRPWWVATTGDGWLQEGVREVQYAARRAGRPTWHLGRSMGRPIPRVSRVDDTELGQLYGATTYVSGLRRCEGFELPCAEGLTCGARPLLYDQPHYTDWYGEWADYLPEGPRAEVEAALDAHFARRPRVVTRAEQQAARVRFDWGPLVRGFWERLQ